MSILMEVWGPMACFTRPAWEPRSSRAPFSSPGAVRGMIESVFFHPGLRWVPDRIWVLNRIQFMNVRRNEVKSKVLASAVLQEANGGKAGAIFTSEDIQQRAAMLLKDVRYVFEAHFEMTVQANPSDNHGKFQDIVKRRLRRGACYSTPYFGCRECTAHFRLWEGGEIPAIDETRDLGYMLYDMDYSDPTDIQPMFFRARMEHGVIDLRNCEVVR